MNGAPVAVRSGFDKAIRGESKIYISSSVAFELWYRIAKSARIESNTQRLEALLSSSVTALPFDNEDSRAAGSIRSVLEVAGRPIGAYDSLIAGQALARQLPLVTANVSEFSRVKALSCHCPAQPY